MTDQPCICRSLFWIGQEMQHGAIVPNVERSTGLPCSNIRTYPGDGSRCWHRLTCFVDCALGDIHHGDIPVALGCQSTRQRRRTRTNVNDRLLSCRCVSCDQLHRGGSVARPRPLIRRFRFVSRLPMFLGAAHDLQSAMSEPINTEGAGRFRDPHPQVRLLQRSSLRFVNLLSCHLH